MWRKLWRLPTPLVGGKTSTATTLYSSTMVTPTQVVPLVLFTVHFFFHTLGLYTALVAHSLFRLHFAFIANLQCTFQALQHFFFFSKFFLIGFTSRPVTKKQKILSDMDTVRAALHFCSFFVPVNICSFVESTWWLPRSLFPPGISVQLPGLPFFCSFTKHVSFWQCSDRQGGSNLSCQALPLWWGGTGHLVPPHQGAVRSSGHQIAWTQVCQCSS